MENTFITNMRIKRISNDQVLDVEDQLVIEEPLEIQVAIWPRGKAGT